MTITTWTYPDGTEHPNLPKTWGNTSGICEANAARLGFVKNEYEPISAPASIPLDPIIPAVHTYSKLRLYDAMVEAGIWTDVKTAIEGAGQWERWTLANDLSTDYAPFEQLLQQLRQTYGDEMTDAILAAAEI